MDYRTLLLARAYAKVNLALSVGPPEPRGAPHAGLHPIASWISCIGLYDDLSFSRLLPGDQSRYQVVTEPDAPRPDPITWPNNQDLAVRAHRILEREADRPLPVRITLRKRIPTGAGLGGGSSDAAAALIGLNRMFGLGFGHDRLVALAAELGSDVPFFIDTDPRRTDGDPGQSPPRPALVTGRGERVKRLPDAPSPTRLLLAIPPFSCSTPDVYRVFDALGQASLRTREVEGLAAAAPDPARLFNDLAPAAEAAEPRLAAVREQIRTITGKPVHISGSGSAMFIIDAGAREAALIADALPEVATVPTTLIG